MLNCLNIAIFYSVVNILNRLSSLRKCSEYHLPVSCSLWKVAWSPMQFRPTQKHYFLRSKNARSHSKTYKTDSLFPSPMVGRFWSWEKIHAKILGFFPFLHFLLSTPFLRPKTWFHQRVSEKKKTVLPGARENKEVVPKRTLQGLFYRHFHMNRDFEFNFWKICFRMFETNLLLWHAEKYFTDLFLKSYFSG